MTTERTSATEGNGMSRNHSDTADALLFMFGGFIFWFVGYVLGCWWSFFSTAFWWANQADKASLIEEHKARTS